MPGVGRFSQVNITKQRPKPRSYTKQRLGISTEILYQLEQEPVNHSTFLLTRQWPKLRKSSQGPKESKARSFLVNISTLKSDPIVLRDNLLSDAENTLSSQ
jgi:hypothetical protein